MKKKKRKSGFTLIELMAVIAIIAILSSVLVPTIKGYIFKANLTKIVENYTEIKKATNAYYIAYNKPPQSIDDIKEYLGETKGKVEGVTYELTDKRTINGKVWEVSLWIRMKNSDSSYRDKVLEGLKAYIPAEDVTFYSNRVLLRLK